MEASIAKDLEPLAFPIDQLQLLPGNPNKGDVESVAASLKRFKQRKAIVARKESDGYNYVIAGNTTLQAARDILKWTHIAVSWADDLDEKETIGYALGDNETARKGQNDEEAELAMIKRISDDYDLLEAAGYDLASIQELEESVPVPMGGGDEVDFETLEDEPEPQREPGSPVVQYTIIFDDEDQQQVWYRYMRWIKKQYPNEDTWGRRLVAHLDQVVPEED